MAPQADRPISEIAETSLVRLRAGAYSSVNTEMSGSVLFTALSDPSRREILALLREQALSAGEIAERIPLAKSTLSGHFAVLREAGLVVSERHGTRIVYSINQSALEEAFEAVLALLGPRKGSVG